MSKLVVFFAIELANNKFECDLKKKKILLLFKIIRGTLTFQKSTPFFTIFKKEIYYGNRILEKKLCNRKNI